MKKVVLDTSVIVKWFSKEKGSQEAKEYLRQLQQGKINIFLPELAKYELANALLKGKGLPVPVAKQALSLFYSLPINFVVETRLAAKSSYKLAQKLKITYYDACFLTLADRLKAILVTANPRHQKKIAGIKKLKRL
mgnify:CR=1 FL=1